MTILFALPPRFENVLITNLIAVVILSFIFFNTYRQKNISFDQKMFRFSIVAVFCSLIFEFAAFLMDGIPASNVTIFISRFCNFLSFGFNPIIGMCWLFYVYYKVTEDEKGLKKKIPYLMIPAAANALLCFLSLFFDIMFIVDENNRYARTPFIWLTFAVTGVYIIAAVIVILRYRKKMPSTSVGPLLFFPVPGLICTVLQMCFYGYSLICLGCAFSLLLISFNVQNEATKTDYLTGLPNRMQLDLLLRAKLDKNSNKCVIGLMADIDNFKKINDTYGHAIGDRALMDIADIFSKSINDKDFVARYGGDEFIFILNGKRTDCEKVIGNLRKKTQEFNQTAERPYKLDFSLGVLEYVVSEKSSTDEFFKLLDKKMYENKLEKKKNGNQ